MKRRTKSPKGPARATSSRGGRGRGGRARGGRRTTETQRGGKASTSGRANSLQNDQSSYYGKSNGHSSSEGPTNGQKPPGDFYLHKKFKKLTNTVESECPATSSITDNHHEESNHNEQRNAIDISSKSSSSISPPNGINSQILPIVNQNHSTNNNNNNMVYKPKFRIASESDSRSEEPMVITGQRQSQQQSTASSTTHASLSSSGSCSSSPEDSNTPHSSEQPGKLSKALRLDRQSLDDRISKIIDENKSLLEWPEPFTKKLKSHTSRNSQSHSHHQQRPQQLTMSGGSTTEFHPSHSSINSSSLPGHHLNNIPHNTLLPTGHHNGLTRHASFDMNSSGGTVELLTNPLILKAQSDMLMKSTFSSHHVVQNPHSPSISVADHHHLPQFPMSSSSPSVIASSTVMVPKKRRTLSPTPSRLCGGEVSELPVNDTPLSKNYYQDVDMNVRVNNCSGAKVTIRTNGGGSGGSVQSGVNFGRYSEPVPSPSLALDNNSSSLFFPSRINERSSSHYEKDEMMTNSISCHSPNKGSRNVSATNKSPPKRKTSRPSKTPIPQSTPPQKMLMSFDSSNKKSADVDHKLLGPQHSQQKPLHCFTTNPTPPSKLPSPRENSKILQSSPKKSEENKAPTTAPIANKNNEAFKIIPPSGNNPKRPNFLALKPVNNVLKKNDHAGVLPSPETPRVAKSYNQMSINGNAYTYLGFKVSTRSSYTCLFKPQPMFIPQQTDPSLSMYSNWQPCPRDPKEPELSMSTNDSRVNVRKDMKTLYTTANGKNCDTLTVSSPGNQPPISSPMTEKNVLTMLANGLVSPPVITSLSRSSEAVSHSKSAFIPSHHNNVIINSSGSHSQSSKQATLTSKTSVSNSSNNNPSLTSVGPTSFASLINNRATTGTTSSRNNKDIRRRQSSSSDFSSGDELDGRNFRIKSERTDSPLALCSKQDSMFNCDMRERDDSNSASDSVIMNRSESSRVKIMEGGFESNEDYTYVRGRGRGRYVCEACGIRCKKPSMLRKHLKTHTDLRPYTCKLCNFSFKTKGNLTKHQKSKSHHKKCISMGIHPDSQQSLATLGPTISDSNSENDTDDDDDDCVDSDEGTSSAGNESESVEKEIAQSLLDLSKMTRMPIHNGVGNRDGTVLIDEQQKYRNNLTRTTSVSFSVNSMLENNDDPLDCSSKMPNRNNIRMETDAPIDLSVKTKPSAEDEPPEPKRPKLELLNGLVRSMGVVGEAQRWEPEEEFISKGSLNLKRILNVGNNKNNVSNNSSSSTQPKSTIHSKTMDIPSMINREIKQEVFEFSVENVEQQRPQLMNGFIKNHTMSRIRQDSESSNSSRRGPRKDSESNSTNSHHKLSRTRQDSETSNSSVSSLTMFASPPDNRSIKNPSDGPSSSSTTPMNAPASLVKLHQPWLSPPEKNSNESDNKSSSTTVSDSIPNSNVTGKQPETATLSQTVATSSTIDDDKVPGTSASANNNSLPTSSSASADNLNFEVPSPNGKIIPATGLKQPQAEFRQPSGAQALVKEDGKAECNVCGKTFARASQLTLHMNIHYLERPFRCDPCGVSFRTKGHLIKHRRSSSHDCKVYLTEAWGVANEENPRPFKCPDCKIAFRIHGHLAKHLRSKMHIMRMECLGKLPFGIYFEMEKSGMNLNEIDTTDCDMSLVSLQNVAKKIYGDTWTERLSAPVEEPA